MTGKKRLYMGVSLIVFGAATVFGEIQLANRAMQLQNNKAFAAINEWAQTHPGQSRGVDVAQYPDTASLGELAGGVLIITGVLVMRGSSAGKQVVG